MRKFSRAAVGIFGVLNLIMAAQAQAFEARSWSGAYLGATMGVVDRHAKTGASTSDEFAGSYFTPPDPEQIAGAADGNMSQSHAAFGLFGGYGQQLGKLYLGVEANVNSLRFDASRSSGATYLSNPAAAFTNEVSVRADWQAMLRARVGWAQDRWLSYVTGGVAATRIKLDAAFSDNLIAGAAGRDSSKETKLGWVIGVGSEYALGDKWTIRGEYLYADYGKVDTSAFVTNPTYPGQGNTLKNSIDLSTQMLSIGLSRRF